MRIIEKIFIHCSASAFGSFGLIDEWHRQRNFPSYECRERKRLCYVGYHKLFLNSYRTYSQLKDSEITSSKVSSITDGQLVLARPIEIAGAHVSGENSTSIGYCYIGFSPTPLQLESMYSECIKDILTYHISIDNVIGHYEHYTRNNLQVLKTCPNFYMPSFRNALKLRME